MDEQDNEPNQDIGLSLRTLIRGLTQNNRAEMYQAYKALFQVGAPAIPQIREAVFKSNWSNLKYPNEIRYVSGLVNLIHDIDEAEARRVANQLKNTGCDVAVARFLDSLCAFGQGPAQEDEADKYSAMAMAKGHPFLFKISRLLNWRSNNRRSVRRQQMENL